MRGGLDRHLVSLVSVCCRFSGLPAAVRKVMKQQWVGEKTVGGHILIINTSWDSDYKLWLPQKSHLCDLLEMRLVREAATDGLLQNKSIEFEGEVGEVFSLPASLARIYLIFEKRYISHEM